LSSFRDFAETCRAIENERSRLKKILALANYLKRLPPEEVGPVSLLMMGKTTSERSGRPLNVGWATVIEVMRSRFSSMLVAEQLKLLDVWESFARIARLAGPGSRERRRAILHALIARADDLEREWLLRILSGEMRHGVNRGLVLEALAQLAGVSPEHVRRADMLLGDIVDLARLAAGRKLETVGVRLFTPVRPMLAEMAVNMGDALRSIGGSGYINPKYDGVRVQIHLSRPEVRIYTRRLQEVTSIIPDIVSKVDDSIRAKSAILDGEVYAVGEGGRPMPFQDTMRRVGRERDTEKAASQLPLELKVFDILLLDGEEVWWRPLRERLALLEKVAGDVLADTIHTSDIGEAEEYYRRSLQLGYEGVMVKDGCSPYSPGRRGGYWLKVKKVYYLDVVIVAAEWGHGRRRGWLSNYHLAVLDESSGEFKTVGKTFKGLTDKEFQGMTQRLQTIKKAEAEWGVIVEPRIVVEVAYSEIQRSPHYPSGYALRFARIMRIRDDKEPGEVDTLERLKKIYQLQSGGDLYQGI